MSVLLLLSASLSSPGNCGKKSREVEEKGGKGSLCRLPVSCFSLVSFITEKAADYLSFPWLAFPPTRLASSQ